MRIIPKAALIVLIAAAPLLFIPGCEGDQGPQGDIGPTGPMGPQGEPGESIPFITGLIQAPRFSMGAQNVFGSADIVVSKTPSLPTVRIDDIVIGRTLFDTEHGLTFSRDDLPVSAGDQVTLTVDYRSNSGDSMQASAGVNIPGDFTIVPESVSVGPDDTLRLDWSHAAGADGYYMIIATWVDHTDTLGNPYRHSFNLDTVVADTFFEISAAPFFPDGIDPDLYLGPQYLLTFIRLSAVSGPVFPEDPQNMTGDGMGFLFGENDGPAIALDLELPAATVRMAGMPESSGLFNYLSKLRRK